MSKSDAEINAEAVETLFSHRLPIVRNEVLSRLSTGPRIPNYGNLDLGRLRLETGQALNGSHPTARIKIEELTAELDRLQECGKQHLLLIRFSGDPQQLAALADPEHARNQLNQFHLADRFNQAHYVDINHVADDPVLAEVRHEPGRLLCKWVERRTWDQMVQTAPGVFNRVTHEARAVNFFDLNLITGAAEVKIQKLKSLALEYRNKKLQEYLQLASDTLGIKGFEPLRLSPAIRHLLSRSDIEMTRVRVKLENGGIWEGGMGDVCPEQPDQLRAAVNLECKWRAADGRTVRLGLDARISELRILNPCSPEQYRAILNDARAWSGDQQPPPETAVPVAVPTGSTPAGSTTQVPTPGQVPVPTTVPLSNQKQPGSTPEGQTPERKPVGSVVLGQPRLRKPETLLERLSRIVKEAKATTQEPLEEAETVKLVKDYVEVEKEKMAAGLGAAGIQAGLTSWTSKEAIETFLKHIKKVLAHEIKLYEQQLEQLTHDERLVFRLSITSIVLALALIIAGSVLIATGLLTFGILSGVVGLLSGSVWMLIQQLANRLEKRRNRLEEKLTERTDLLTAVESSLILGEVKAMQAVAERLWQFASAALPKNP